MTKSSKAGIKVKMRQKTEDRRPKTRGGLGVGLEKLKVLNIYL
jgi:hypothetical protein